MKKIVICSDLNPACSKTLSRLPQIMDLKNTQIFFIHVFQSQLYNFDLVPYVFPLPEQRPTIESSTNGLLSELGKNLDLKPGSFKVNCFFSYSRNEKIKEFLDDVKADLVVIATRGKHGVDGFFSSSLADYLCKFSPCDIFVMRP